jgi:hypothetical protein
MQERIVLSEGKNDVNLVYSFFEEFDGTYEVDRFYGEDVQTVLQNAESDKISNFRGPQNDYHVLAKSENNKDGLQQVFVALLNQLLSKRVYTPVCLLVDLDGGDLQTFLDDLREQIQGRHGSRGIELGDHTLAERNRHMVAADCEVLTREGQVKGEFHVVAFRQTLERLTDIDRENDERDVKNEKIEQLLEDDHVFDMLDSVLRQWDD